MGSKHNRLAKRICRNVHKFFLGCGEAGDIRQFENDVCFSIFYTFHQIGAIIALRMHIHLISSVNTEESAKIELYDHFVSRRQIN